MRALCTVIRSKNLRPRQVCGGKSRNHVTDADPAFIREGKLVADIVRVGGEGLASLDLAIRLRHGISAQAEGETRHHCTEFRRLLGQLDPLGIVVSEEKGPVERLLIPPLDARASRELEGAARGAIARAEVASTGVVFMFQSIDESLAFPGVHEVIDLPERRIGAGLGAGIEDRVAAETLGAG